MNSEYDKYDIRVSTLSQYNDRLKLNEDAKLPNEGEWRTRVDQARQICLDD